MSDSVTFNPSITVVDADRSIHLFLPGCGATTLRDADAERISALHETLLGLVEETTARAELGAELLDRLIDQNLVVVGEKAELEGLRPDVPPNLERPLRHLVLGVCGTVATAMVVPQMVAFAIDVLADQVDVILTKSAKRFLRPRVLRYLGARTFSNGFKPKPSAAVPHIHLAQEADAVLIAPASAATLTKLATGACNDLLSLIAAATTAPVIVAPVMNGAMWRHPTTVRNVERLRADGVYIVAPGRARSVASRTIRSATGGKPEVGAMGLLPSNIVAVVSGIVGLNQ
jgi:hypothetical protein